MGRGQTTSVTPGGWRERPGPTTMGMSATTRGGPTLATTDNQPSEGDPGLAPPAVPAAPLPASPVPGSPVAAKTVETGAGPGGPARFRAVGERSQPANGGDLGYTYTLYRFYDVDDRLLYLGRSERVRQRVVDDEVGHPRGLPLGHDDGPKPWWREAGRIELEHLPPGTTDAEARAEERRQIEAFRPVYNQEFNEDVYDRTQLERAIDTAHFEVDVATAEHDRHDGVIRPMPRIVVESERAAERLRPAGAARLHYGIRRDPAQPGSVGAVGASRAVAGSRSRSFEGPGSIAGLVVVLAILLGLVIGALVVSIRVVL